MEGVSTVSSEWLSRAKLEDGKVWLRYIGFVGPEAKTVLARMWWGDCALVPLDDAEFVLTSEDFQVLVNGRCKGIMKFSKERCIQECAEGHDLCAMHLLEEKGR